MTDPTSTEKPSELTTPDDQQDKRIIEAAIAYVNRYGSGTSAVSKELYYAVRSRNLDVENLSHKG